VLSTGADAGSEATLDEAQVGLIQKGAQLISVLYDGGDLQLARSVSRTAGVELSAPEPGDVGPAVSRAAAIAGDRLLVSFRTGTEVGSRSNVTLELGGLSTTFSYPAGVQTGIVLQLAPQPETEAGRLGLLTSSVGLYVSLALAFVGIVLGVWALGSIMAGGDRSLEGMLSRYTEGAPEAGDVDVEELIVQSALLQRAVSFSESFAERQGFLTRVEELLERANLPIRPGEAMFILAAITVLSSSLGLAATRSFIAAALFGAFATALAFFVVRFLARRRFKTFESQLPDTLQLLAGTLRAGYSLPQGFEVVSKEIADPMGHELRRAMSEARLGRDIEECLAGVADRLSSADFAWAVMAISIQREVGGNLNELLTSVADTMIARERLKREISALTAEGRMSAAVLSFLPPGLGLVMWVMNPGYVGLLFSEFLGNVLLAMGLVSGFIGLAWMKKVITVDV
jgi:tight adherence protein B